ncbi:MAG: hypothetical protein VX938_08660 [Myxococcota bacterium]|nr:hypothetical protein [Myxococcota bacterium]
MSDNSSHGPVDGAEIIDLACARMEDALAEGRLDQRALAHLETCPRCLSMKTEMDSIAALIAEATGPTELDPSFEQGILDRAREMTFDLDARIPEAPLPRANYGRRAALLAAAAAALTLAYWAGGEQLDGSSPSPRAVAPIAIADPAVPPVTDQAIAPQVPTGPAGGPVMMIPKKTPPPPVAGVKTTQRVHRPITETLPEPMVDLPAEIRDAIIRHVRSQETCPRKVSRAVRLTLTVETNGAITNRQILSSADAGDAHRCVSRALDALLLPPMPEPATLTLDVGW